MPLFKFLWEISHLTLSFEPDANILLDNALNLPDEDKLFCVAPSASVLSSNVTAEVPSEPPPIGFWSAPPILAKKVPEAADPFP